MTTSNGNGAARGDAHWVGWLASACQCAIETLRRGDAREARRQLQADLNAFLRSPDATQELKDILKGAR